MFNISFVSPQIFLYREKQSPLRLKYTWAPQIENTAVLGGLVLRRGSPALSGPMGIGTYADPIISYFEGLPARHGHLRHI